MMFILLVIEDRVFSFVLGAWGFRCMGCSLQNLNIKVNILFDVFKYIVDRWIEHKYSDGYRKSYVSVYFSYAFQVK